GGGSLSQLGVADDTHHQDLLVIGRDRWCSQEPAVWEPSGKPTRDLVEFCLFHDYNITPSGEVTSPDSPLPLPMSPGCRGRARLATVRGGGLPRLPPLPMSVGCHGRSRRAKVGGPSPDLLLPFGGERSAGRRHPLPRPMPNVLFRYDG